MQTINRAWALGVLLILAFAVVGELLVLFDDYVFYRLGISRNLALALLWALPFLAAYVAARYSPGNKIAAGLSFLILFPLIGAATHLMSDALGATVDFGGFSGARVVFGLYLMIGSLLIIAGTILGVVLSGKEGRASDK